jgi:hypothetical protein
MALVYEKTGLDNKDHYVELLNLDTSKNFVFDAIDIDSTGSILPFETVENLQAIAGTSSVNLQWDPVISTTSYIIRRSTIPGGPYDSNIPYEPVVTGSAITFSDEDVIPGTTYYYVVSAVVSGIESPNSHEASATPTEETTDPGHEGNYSTLILTMTNGGLKSYDLSINDLDNFLTWYDNRSNGEGRTYYTFIKTTNIAPYLSVKEYVSFDKISSFEVKEYNQ